MTTFFDQFDFTNLAMKLDPTKWTGTVLTSVQYAGALAVAFAYLGFSLIWVAAVAFLGLTAKNASWALVASLVAVGYGRRFGPSWLMYVGLGLSYYFIYGLPKSS
ncbi:VP4 [Inopus flavus jingmenvirus 1]|nr:VP4 [Inopus flavus jingmenvirus 1]